MIVTGKKIVTGIPKTMCSIVIEAASKTKSRKKSRVGGAYDR